MEARALSTVTALAVVATTTVALVGADARAGEHDAGGLPIGFPMDPPGYEPVPQGLGITVESVPCAEPRIMFINFDGAKLQSGCGNDSHNDCSTMAGMFGGEILPYPGDEGIRAAIAQGVRADADFFDLTVTDVRPPDSADYVMVLVGNSVLGGAEYHGFAGVSPSIDCGDSNPNETCFSLANSYNGNGMSTVVSHEAGHTWGLEHVNEKSDQMYPTAGAVLDPKFVDGCYQCVSDTMLNPSGGVCNSVHTMFCNSAQQNSYQELLWLFGPPNPDAVAPEIVIEAPTEGEVLPHPADFDLVITMSDNETPQVIDTRIYLDDELVVEDEYVPTTLSFPIQGGVDVGDHSFRIEIADEAGNLASDEVSFAVGSGGGDDGDTGDDGTDGGGTGDGGDGDGDGGGGDGDGPTTAATAGTAKQTGRAPRTTRAADVPRRPYLRRRHCGSHRCWSPP
jgi:hypothetical protein